MISYQTAWCMDYTDQHAISGNAFVMAKSSKEAKDITLTAIKNTYPNVTILYWLKTVQRKPNSERLEKYITATSHLE